ncbi:MAG TPA: PEP-CTERM sorting domain-containing protein [Gammaproteobacteria bacterium]|nr:PEP-CTERM sorting domain-containing protein [Gammaproteobacteria bacterium]
MKKLKLLVLATIASGMVLSAQAFATPTVTVDGITFTTGTTFYVSNVYENTVSDVGDMLSGYGSISFDSSTGLSCAAGDGNCSLTFDFSGYTVTDITSDTVDFNGGMVNLYTGDGDLFLALSGHFYANENNGRSGTLLGSFAVTGVPDAGFNGSGLGELDVTGGDASSFFDTNTIADGLDGFADFYFNSSFSNVCADGVELCGSADLHGFAVPEPGALGMMGFGLLMLGGVLRWRGKAK